MTHSSLGAAGRSYNTTTRTLLLPGLATVLCLPRNILSNKRKLAFISDSHFTKVSQEVTSRALAVAFH